MYRDANLKKKVDNLSPEQSWWWYVAGYYVLVSLPGVLVPLWTLQYHWFRTEIIVHIKAVVFWLYGFLGSFVWVFFCFLLVLGKGGCGFFSLFWGFFGFFCWFFSIFWEQNLRNIKVAEISWLLWDWRTLRTPKLWSLNCSTFLT